MTHEADINAYKLLKLTIFRLMGFGHDIVQVYQSSIKEAHIENHGSKFTAGDRRRHAPPCLRMAHGQAGGILLAPPIYSPIKWQAYHRHGTRGVKRFVIRLGLALADAKPRPLDAFATLRTMGAAPKIIGSLTYGRNL